jgi:hypothetical protein
MQVDLQTLIKYQGNYLNGVSHFLRELAYEPELKDIITYIFLEPNNKTLSLVHTDTKTYSDKLLFNIPIDLFSLNNVITSYNLFYKDKDKVVSLFDGQGFIKLSFIEYIRNLINETK